MAYRKTNHLSSKTQQHLGSSWVTYSTRGANGPGSTTVLLLRHSPASLYIGKRRDRNAGCTCSVSESCYPLLRLMCSSHFVKHTNVLTICWRALRNTRVNHATLSTTTFHQILSMMQLNSSKPRQPTRSTARTPRSTRMIPTWLWRSMQRKQDNKRNNKRANPNAIQQWGMKVVPPRVVRRRLDLHFHQHHHHLCNHRHHHHCNLYINNYMRR